MTDNPPKQVFYEKAMTMLQAAITQVCVEVPEVEAVGVVYLWRMPGGQDQVPSVMIQGASGPLSNPDQLLRLHLATCRLEQFCIDKTAAGVVALRELASNLAREARQAHAADEITPPGQAQP